MNSTSHSILSAVVRERYCVRYLSIQDKAYFRDNILLAVRASHACKGFHDLPSPSGIHAPGLIETPQPKPETPSLFLLDEALEFDKLEGVNTWIIPQCMLGAHTLKPTGWKGTMACSDMPDQCTHAPCMWVVPWCGKQHDAPTLGYGTDNGPSHCPSGLQICYGPGSLGVP